MKIYRFIITLLCIITISSGCGKNNIKTLCDYIEQENIAAVKTILPTVENLDQETGALNKVTYILTQGQYENRTPLYCACRTGNSELIQMLLDAGADPNYTGTGLATPVEVYCAENVADSTDILKSLLDHGADPNAYTYEPAAFRLSRRLQYMTPEKAKDAGDMITTLLDRGANIHYTDCEGTYTLLFGAVQSPDLSLLEALLQDYNGAAWLDIQDHEGDTVMDIAKAIGNDKAIRLIEEAQNGY